MTRWLNANSRFRVVSDLAWLVGLTIVGLQFFMLPKAASPLNSGVQLALIEGTQHRGFYAQGKRLGAMVEKIAKTKNGWRVVEIFHWGNTQKEQEQVGQAILELRKDLSLQSFKVVADLMRLVSLTGIDPRVASSFKLGRLDVKGKCSVAMGECRVRGSLGKRGIAQMVTIGRGPVLTSAIYPLLAKGALSREVELSIFDPLSLQARVITYKILGQDKLKLQGQMHEAVLVEQEYAGILTKLWLDRRGHVLKEQLPLGLEVQLESWGAHP
ncbi:MAG: hypothetical protein V1754_07085 [Pseudomonadota bacterium]